jgi:hypothetical protein
VTVSLALPPVLLTVGPRAGAPLLRYRSVYLPVAAGLLIALFASTTADLAVLVPATLLLAMATIDATFTVIEYEPTAKFCLEGEARGVRPTGCLHLSGTESATEMTFVGEYQGGPFFQLFRHVSRPFVQRNVTTTVRVIRQLLEEREPT